MLNDKKIKRFTDWMRARNMSDKTIKAYKFHLARNLGLDFAKPDRHLQRIAQSYNTTPQELCEHIQTNR